MRTATALINEKALNLCQHVIRLVKNPWDEPTLSSILQGSTSFSDDEGGPSKFLFRFQSSSRNLLPRRSSWSFLNKRSSKSHLCLVFEWIILVLQCWSFARWRQRRCWRSGWRCCAIPSARTLPWSWWPCAGNASNRPRRASSPSRARRRRRSTGTICTSPSFTASRRTTKSSSSSSSCRWMMATSWWSASWPEDPPRRLPPSWRYFSHHQWNICAGRWYWFEFQSIFR